MSPMLPVNASQWAYNQGMRAGIHVPLSARIVFKE